MAPEFSKINFELSRKVGAYRYSYAGPNAGMDVIHGRVSAQKTQALTSRATNVLLPRGRPAYSHRQAARKHGSAPDWSCQRSEWGSTAQILRAGPRSFGTKHWPASDIGVDDGGYIKVDWLVVRGVLERHALPCLAMALMLKNMQYAQSS